ncbi:unnamed protein product [Ixodes pacificus]
MYGFLTARFENTTAQVQEQALYWLQILTMLEVPVPMNLLFSMFPAGVQATLGPAPSSSEPKEEAHVATLTPKFHPLRQDTTGSILKHSHSFLPEDAPPREDKSDAELCLSCHILMVDILIKQLELQEVTPHRGLNTSEAREILSLLHAMLRYPRAEHQCCQAGSAGGAGGVPAACLFCEMSAIWYQLVLSLIEFFCPVMEVAMADVSMVPGTRFEPVLSSDFKTFFDFGTSQNKSTLRCSERVSLLDIVLKTCFFCFSPEAPHEHEVGPSPEGPVLMTATVQECPGQLDTVAIMPTEQVVTAFARAVTLTEDDVPEAKCTVASATLVDENDRAVVAPEPVDDASFWQTSQGKFRFTIDELPPQLRLVYVLLREMAVHEDADVLYHLLTCLKLLSLHAEVLNKAAHDHRGFLIWCQENLLVSK